MTSHVLLGVDDKEIAYSAFLSTLDQHILTITTSENSALHLVDENIDLIFLERPFIEPLASKLFERIRKQKYSCQVAIITGAEPNFDTCNTPFDAFLTKPIDNTELKQTTRKLAKRSELDDALKDYANLTSKLCQMKQKHSKKRLNQDQQFKEVETRINQLEIKIDSLSTDLTNKDLFDVISHSSAEPELGTLYPDVDG